MYDELHENCYSGIILILLNNDLFMILKIMHTLKPQFMILKILLFWIYFLYGILLHELDIKK